MLTDPKNILFENSTDLVDYVSKGIPPRKKNYEKLKIAMANPVSNPEFYGGKSVAVGKKLVEDLTQEELIKIFDQFYANQRKNYAIGAVIGVGVAAICGVVGFAVGCSKTDEKWAERLDGCSLNF